jgi:hypothetical protein
MLHGRTETLITKKLKQTNETIYNSWKSIMHLPYAFGPQDVVRNLCFRTETKK